MAKDLERAIQELSLRMRLLKAAQEDCSDLPDLTDRDVMILSLLKERGKMTVSQIAVADPAASDSTISTNVTKLWRNEMVSKTISPKNQRVTIIDLTSKGKKAFETVAKQRSERFQSLFQAIQVTDGEKQVLIDVCTRAVKFMDKQFGFFQGTNGAEK